MAGAGSTLFDMGTLLLFAMEFYHVLAHCMILCGIRTLPRKDLLRIRFYFLVDCMTVVCSSVLVTGRMQWLMALHLGQHLFYFFTWDKSYMAKKIIDWSSLEYFNKSHPVELDSTLGTMFDVVVHLAMMYALFPMLSTYKVIGALLIAQIGLFSVLFNPKFAWSSPSNMPKWVQKRLGKLALEKNQDDDSTKTETDKTASATETIKTK